jgi:hypothetical protein
MSMNLRIIVFLFTIAIGVSTVRDGRADPRGAKTKFDFAIVDASCQMLVSALANIPGKDAVSVVKGEARLEMCWRKSRNVHCEYSSDGGKTSTNVDYSVRVDTAALIEMVNDTASEVTYIDPVNHIAITIGRTFTTTNRAGATIHVVFVKTCKGSYLTYDEAQALDSKR